MDVRLRESRRKMTERDELEMLQLIVNAMLDSQPELQAATVAQWSTILADSCRRHRAGRVPAKPRRPLAQVAA